MAIPIRYRGNRYAAEISTLSVAAPVVTLDTRNSLAFPAIRPPKKTEVAKATIATVTVSAKIVR